ncbi:MAG: hypothetical protein O3C40_25515 [Planctomycetota bacterium]|nr:hypothetical protein [Planctomycetota bacterium]
MNVEQSRIGVDVHRQIDLAVTHRRLRGPRRDARFAQVRSERVTQSVYIDRPPAIVCLCDAGKRQIPIENPLQAGGNVENRGIRWQPHRQRLEPRAGFGL